MNNESILQSAFEESQDFVCFLDSEAKFIWVNSEFASFLGIKKNDFPGKYFESTLSTSIDSILLKEFITNSNKKISDTVEFKHLDKNKSKIQLSWKITWNEESGFYLLLAKNNYELNFIKELDLIQRKSIEESMNPKLDLSQLITIYTRGLEKLFPDMITSVLTVKDNKVWNLTSHSLPKDYLALINGEPIGPNAGSCGTAAFILDKVIVEDISSDARWTKYKDIAANFELAACWSQPIFNREGKVIATFANYYKTKKNPSRLELEIFDKSASLIKLIMDNFEKRKELSLNNEGFEFINRATNDAIYEWDISKDHLIWGESFEKLFGYSTSHFPLTLKRWSNLVHPNDLQSIDLSLENFLNDREAFRWTYQYRLQKADGLYSYVEENGYVVRDETGKATRMYGVLRDITNSKNNELHKELLTRITKFFSGEDNLKN